MSKDRTITLKFGEVETARYYAEILKFEFDNGIMSEHFEILGQFQSNYAVPGSSPIQTI